jgi:hypothetical protein
MLSRNTLEDVACKTWGNFQVPSIRTHAYRCDKATVQISSSSDSLRLPGDSCLHEICFKFSMQGAGNKETCFQSAEFDIEEIVRARA